MSHDMASWIDVLRELQPEIDEANRIQPKPGIPLGGTSLGEVLRELGSLPPEAFFFGMATDGLPVLLNMNDPIAGALLVLAHEGSGKTDFLRTVAETVSVTHPRAGSSGTYGYYPSSYTKRVDVSIITNHPDEFNVSNNLNVLNKRTFGFYETASEELILSLASWAHGNKGNSGHAILLIDGFENVSSLSFDAKQNLRWLLLRGSARKVWVIATLNPKYADDVAWWLDAFKTIVYGSDLSKEEIESITGREGILEDSKFPSQFKFIEGTRWCNFWVPSV